MSFQTIENIKKLFPDLDFSGAKITSPVDYFNNCYAWAAGDKGNRWEPLPPHVWFTDSNADTLANHITNYGYVGFEETDSRELEAGIEKIAIYADKNGFVKHAARMTENGAWTSKLGNLEDIEHKTLECLEGNEYGTVQAILKRAFGDPDKWVEKAKEIRLNS